MDQWSFRLSWDPNLEEAPDELLRREWILTNGLGGYACGTLSGVPTRRYHGLLISALPSPHGRQLVFNHLSDLLTFSDSSSAYLSSGLPSLAPENAARFRLTEFRLDMGLPVWRYERHGYAIERRILMLHEQNTVHIRYEMLNGQQGLNLRLHPSIHFRSHDANPQIVELNSYFVSHLDFGSEISAKESKLPPLRIRLQAEEKTFTQESQSTVLLYREELNRGYPSDGNLWTPGFFQAVLRPGSPVTLSASTEPWESILALSPDEAYESERNRRTRLRTMSAPELQEGAPRQLVLSADQFIITPAGRLEDSARARAGGEQSRSIIAGYHWFTDWGRDTMISLEGLTLDTGRHAEARWILHTFALYIRDGLIPNLFPEGRREGLYHTADATLWYFHALSRYVDVTGDLETLRELLPKLIDIIEIHIRGTHFGIGMDPADMLLRQGAVGYQLTWMDAKVDDWVVTPRRGKAVEINALWYNALRLLEQWLRMENRLAEAAQIKGLSDDVYHSFNARFWNDDTGYLFDVLDGETGNDPACRPNQIFSISLPHPVLKEARWKPILDIVEQRLLTPVGLRSLSREHPDYKATYNGDLRSRDAAYHQGTVWSWLIGPFVDAWMKVHPGEPDTARSFLDGLVAHLTDAGVGTVSEIFDAEPPFTPRGCIAQAWSVAEVLRIWRKTGVERERKAIGFTHSSD